MEYSDFLDHKSQLGGMAGFTPLYMPDFLFDFQKFLLDWQIKKGKGAIFADTGLGKTPMQLVYAENVVRKTNGNILLLTPLAVSHQTIKEAEKFGIEANRSRDGKPHGKITVSNYEQLEKFDPNDFVGCVCDESSAIKNATSMTKKMVVRFMQKMPYRALFTATPSPNDYVELGTSSETLGELAYMDMIAQFFRDTSNDKNPQWSKSKYELKQHGISDFWRWVCSWSRAIKKPSDYGFDDSRFILPQLIETDYVLQATKPMPGELFVRKARTLNDQRVERKLTIEERCGKVKELASGHDVSVIWAHYNYETDLLEKIIPGAVQISGSDSDDEKEEKFIAFSTGQIKKIVIKPVIGAWGLNWQHCNHMVFFPSHSYEQYYQAVRRCYRYGQKRDVYIDMVTTEGELGVYHNIKRKSDDAVLMFKMMIEYMSNELKIQAKEHINNQITLPKWI